MSDQSDDAAQPQDGESISDLNDSSSNEPDSDDSNDDNGADECFDGYHQTKA